jgi:hypothetical protein
VLFAVPMFHIKSFPPDTIPSSKRYHYHDDSDFDSEKMEDIWLWLLDHQHREKIVLIKDESCYSPVISLCKTEGSLSDSELQSVPLIDEVGTDSFDRIRFLPFHDVSVLQRVADSMGNIWEISIEIPEGTGSTDALLIRTYRLHLLQNKGLEIESNLQSKQSTNCFFQIISLNAQWDVDHFPAIAEFKRKVIATV